MTDIEKQELCENIINEIFKKNKWDASKINEMSIGITKDGALCGRKPSNWDKVLKKGLLADETVRMIPVLEISELIWDAEEYPYAYKIYDKEWLQNA